MHLWGDLAIEEVDEEGTELNVTWVGVEEGRGEVEEGAVAGGAFRCLEFGHSDEVIHAYFDEIENLPIVHPHERESIRPFLRTLRNDEQRCVVFLGPEFKGGGIFEGANGVLFGERDCVGSFERHKVLHSWACALAYVCTLDEDTCSCVFDLFWLSCVHRSFRAGIFGFYCLEHRESKGVNEVS